jgi:hypothetical protein
MSDDDDFFENGSKPDDRALAALENVTSLSGDRPRAARPAEHELIAIPSQDTEVGLVSKPASFPVVADDDECVLSVFSSSSGEEAHEDEKLDAGTDTSVDDAIDIEIEDEIDDDFSGVETLFQSSAACTQVTVTKITPEDATLDPVAIALKYAFGIRAFRGQQQVRLESTPL